MRASGGRSRRPPGARVRHIGGTLGQQLLLAVLHRDEGDEAGARAIAGEVLRWANAIGATGQVRQAEAFLAGVDPTRAPRRAALTDA